MKIKKMTYIFKGGAYSAPSFDLLDMSNDNVLCNSADGTAENFIIDEDYNW